MKSFFSVLALPALFASTLAAPTAISAAAVEKRQEAAAYAIVDSLYTNIQQYTGAISTSRLPAHSVQQRR